MINDWKIERIKSINDEVHELHPLLRDLFRNIPNVQHVDYTQGNRELGADFVITKLEPTIFSEDYIGVVVKADQIKQDHEDVRRQVRECALPRPIEGGKKTIYLTEIWVITSKNITRGAQDVINGEYKNTKIRWFDAEKLVKLIDNYLPTFWEHENARVSTYITEQRQWIESHASLHSLLSTRLTHIHIDQQIQQISEENRHKFRRKLPKTTQLIAEISKKNLIYIEGQMGAGKSQLLRSTALSLCSDENIKKYGLIPKFLTYRELVDDGQSLLAIAKSIREALNDSEKTIVFFVDGADETLQPLPSKIDFICDCAKDVQADQKIKLVISSREVKEADLSEKLSKYFDKYSVCPLNHSGIMRFIEQLCKQYSMNNRFKSDLERSPLMRALPRTPLSAILLGKLISERVKELPSTLPELYAKYTELALGRWDLAKGNGSEKEYETISRITSHVAHYMFENDLEVIAMTELREMFSSYLSQRRTGQNELLLLENFLSKQEILSFDPTNDVMHFRHRTFLEFFSAVWTYQEKGKTAELDDPFSMERGAKEYFYLGLIKDAAERIELLRLRVPQEDLDRIMKAGSMGNFLMAAYQTPYTTITKAIYDTFLDLSRLYDEVSNQKRSSWLHRLPELQILAFFTQVVKSSYSYDFFVDAIKESKLIAEIDSGISDDIRVVLLFLFDAVLADMGDPSAFSQLVEKYDAMSSWTIRLGISAASEEAKFVNDATKKVEKRIQKSARNNMNLITHLQDLQTKPIEKIKLIIK